MSNVNIHQKVRSTVAAMLASNFNATLTSISNAYHVPGFTIDFADKSKNFFNGNYAATDLISTSSVKFPVVCLYTIKSQNTNSEMFRVWSGTSLIGIDVYLSWNKSAALSDTETLGDAVSDCLVNVFNSEANQSQYTSVIYNGDIQFNKGTVTQAANNWLQLLQCRLSFDFNI